MTPLRPELAQTRTPPATEGVGGAEIAVSANAVRCGQSGDGGPRSADPGPGASGPRPVGRSCGLRPGYLGTQVDTGAVLAVVTPD